MLDIFGNAGIRLTVADQTIDVIDTGIHGLRQQPQTGLGGLDQRVLQIVLENIVTEQTDQQAHPQNCAQRKNQDTISYTF